jgi:hypothetical protein
MHSHRTDQLRLRLVLSTSSKSVLLTASSSRSRGPSILLLEMLQDFPYSVPAASVLTGLPLLKCGVAGSTITVISPST